MGVVGQFTMLLLLFAHPVVDVRAVERGGQNPSHSAINAQIAALPIVKAADVVMRAVSSELRLLLLAVVGIQETRSHW